MSVSLSKLLFRVVSDLSLPVQCEEEDVEEQFKPPLYLLRKEDRKLRQLRDEGLVDCTGKILPGVVLPKRPELNTKSTRDRHQDALLSPIVIQVLTYTIQVSTLDYFRFLKLKCEGADIRWVGSVNRYILNAKFFDDSAKALSSCFEDDTSAPVDLPVDRDVRFILKVSNPSLMEKISLEVAEEFLAPAFKQAYPFLKDDWAKEIASTALPTAIPIGTGKEGSPQFVMWGLGKIGKLDTTVAANLAISSIKSTDRLQLNLLNNLVYRECWNLELAEISDEDFYQAILDYKLKRVRFLDLQIPGHKRWRHLMACLSNENIPSDRSDRKILRAEFLQSLSKQKSPEARKKKLALMAEGLTLFLGEHFPSSNRALVTKLHMLFDLAEALCDEELLFLSQNIKPKPGRVKKDVKPIFQELDELCQSVGPKYCKDALTLLCYKAFEAGGWSRADSVVTLGDPEIDPCFQLLLASGDETYSLYLPIENLEDPWAYNRDVQDFQEILLKMSASGKPVTKDIKTFLEGLLPRNAPLALKLCETAKPWLKSKDHYALEATLLGQLLDRDPNRIRSFLKNEELPMTQEVLTNTLERLNLLPSDWVTVRAALQKCSEWDDTHRLKLEGWIQAYIEQADHFLNAFDLLCFCKEHAILDPKIPFWVEPMRAFLKKNSEEDFLIASSVCLIDEARRLNLELSDELVVDMVESYCACGFPNDAARIVSEYRLAQGGLLTILNALSEPIHWPLVHACSKSLNDDSSAAFITWLSHRLNSPQAVLMLRSLKNANISSTLWVEAMQVDLDFQETNHAEFFDELQKRQVDLGKADAKKLKSYLLSAFDYALSYNDLNMMNALIPLLKRHVKDWENKQIKIRFDHGETISIEEFEIAYATDSSEELRVRTLKENYHEGRHKEVYDSLKRKGVKDMKSFLGPFTKSYARAASKSSSFVPFLSFINDNTLLSPEEIRIALEKVNLVGLIDAFGSTHCTFSEDFLCEVVVQCCRLDLHEHARTALSFTQMTPSLFLRILKGLQPTLADWAVIDFCFQHSAELQGRDASTFADWLNAHIAQHNAISFIRTCQGLDFTPTLWIRALKADLDLQCHTIQGLSTHFEFFKEIVGKKINFSKANTEDLRNYLFQALDYAYRHDDQHFRTALLPHLRQHIQGWEKEEIRLRANHACLVAPKEFAAAIPLTDSMEDLRLSVLERNYHEGKHKEVHEYLKNHRLKDMDGFLIPFAYSYAHAIDADYTFIQFLGFLNDEILFSRISSAARNEILSAVFKAKTQFSADQRMQLWETVSRHYHSLKTLPPHLCRELAFLLNQPFGIKQSPPKALLAHLSNYVETLANAGHREDILPMVVGAEMHRANLALSKTARNCFIDAAYTYFFHGPVPFSMQVTDAPPVKVTLVKGKRKSKAVLKSPPVPQRPTAEPVISAIFRCITANKEHLEEHRSKVLGIFLMSFDFHQKENLPSKAKEDVRLLKEWGATPSELEQLPHSEAAIRVIFQEPVHVLIKDCPKVAEEIAPPKELSVEDKLTQLLNKTSFSYKEIEAEVRARGFDQLAPHDVRLARLFANAPKVESWAPVSLEILAQSPVLSEADRLDIFKIILQKAKTKDASFSLKVAAMERIIGRDTYLRAYLKSSLPVTGSIDEMVQEALNKPGDPPSDLAEILYDYLLRVGQEEKEDEVLVHSRAALLTDAQMEVITKKLLQRYSGKSGIIYPKVLKTLYQDSRQVFQFALLCHILPTAKDTKGLEILPEITNEFLNSLPRVNPLPLLNTMISSLSLMPVSIPETLLILGDKPTAPYQHHKDFNARLGKTITVFLNIITQVNPFVFVSVKDLLWKFLEQENIRPHIDISSPEIIQAIIQVLAAKTPVSMPTETSVAYLEKPPVGDEIAKMQLLLRHMRTYKAGTIPEKDLASVFILAVGIAVRACMKIKDDRKRHEKVSDIRRSMSKAPGSNNDWRLPALKIPDQLISHYQSALTIELNSVPGAPKEALQIWNRTMAEIVMGTCLQSQVRLYSGWISALENYVKEETDPKSIQLHFMQLCGSFKKNVNALVNANDDVLELLKRLWRIEIKNATLFENNEALECLKSLEITVKLVEGGTQTKLHLQDIWEEIHLAAIQKILGLKDISAAYYWLSFFSKNIPAKNERLWKARHLACIDILFKRNHASSGPNLSKEMNWEDLWINEWHLYWTSFTQDANLPKDQSITSDVVVALIEVFIEHARTTTMTKTLEITIPSVQTQLNLLQSIIPQGKREELDQRMNELFNQ